ncbi:MAG: hypothetical protein Q4F95_09750 [Oscillospiraceae bacterium]|nr:hypothetical protein [Oscillospiraceae bacterium]
MNNDSGNKIKHVMEDKTLEQLEKESKTNTLIFGSVFTLIGIVFIAASGNSLNYSARIRGIIIGTLIILSGLYFLSRKEIEKLRRIQLKDENSLMYKIKHSGMEKKQRRWLNKAQHHNSLKHEASRNIKIITGIFTATAFFLTWFVSRSEKLPAAFYFLDIGAVISFGYSFLGRKYKKLLKHYSEYGFDEQMAEKDFEQSNLYRKYAAVSKRFMTMFSPAVLLPVEKIVWVFPKVSYTYHYFNCIYCGIKEQYSVMIYDENGSYFILDCPEALCKIIIDEIIAAGTAVTSGYSDELAHLYSASPGNFRNAVRGCQAPFPYQMPANEIN